MSPQASNGPVWKDSGVSMEGGSSETSYVKNSRQQRHMVNAVESDLWESLPSLPRIPQVAPGDCSLRIADLGCATGSNTLSTIDKTLSHLSALLESRSVPVPPQAQAFFNDTPGNDFNTLFRSFSPYAGPGSTGGDGRSYFAAGVPGSFHGRLFPSGSIHAFTCFLALHFMSQVPEEVLDKKSPAFNKGRIWHDGSSLAVRQAFSKAYVKELAHCLTARAEELVSSGLMIAVVAGSPSFDNRAAGTKVMDDSVQALVAEGVLDEDVVDMFNMPLRFATQEEVRNAVEMCGLFDTHVLQSNRVHLYTDQARAELQADAKLCAQTYTNAARTVFLPVLQGQFGSEATELLFQRHELLVEKDHIAVLDGLDRPLHLLVLSRK